MPSLPLRCLVLFALCAAATPAREVYKCTTSQGVAFQDQPCAAAAEETRLSVAGTDPAPVAPAAADIAAREPPPPAPKAQEPRPRKPLPSLWLCTNAEDGSRYVSRSGPPPPRSVPLGALGFSDKSLAQAYGAGTHHMSSPDAGGKIPVDASPQAAATAGYTTIQDACALATVEQTCAWLRGELDATNDKLGRARFKDEQTQLQSQADGLADDLGGC